MVKLSERWSPLRPHASQRALWECTKRFVIIEAGRRSGKTELAKRRGVLHAIEQTRFGDYLCVFGAPTVDQARSIFWDHLKELVPSKLIVGKPNETHFEIRLVNGSMIRVVGLDKPHRIEGVPIDECYIDEFADCKSGLFDRTLRPGLSTIGRPGQGWFFGVPRPSMQFKALVDLATIARDPEFAYFHWLSSTVLPPEEIAAAKRSMDPLMFAQEFEASRVNFAGRAYYPFTRDVHAKFELPWVRDAELLISFDFNNSPGTAAVHHQFESNESMRAALPGLDRLFIGTIGEVWIPRDSTSERVSRVLVEKFGEHRGDVIVYGDATGGARGSAKVAGSDWDIVKRVLKAKFGDRVKMRVPESNPLERVRINSTNAQLMAADGTVRYLVDAKKAPHVVEDFENTVTLEGTAGELDKSDSDSPWTHLTDGVGYMIHRRNPLESEAARFHVLQIAQ